jgi:hypothetical protein
MRNTVPMGDDRGVNNALEKAVRAAGAPDFGLFQ